MKHQSSPRPSRGQRPKRDRGDASPDVPALPIDLARILETNRRLEQEEDLSAIEALIWSRIQKKLQPKGRQARDTSTIPIADLLDLVVQNDLPFIARQLEHFGVPPADIEDVTQEVLAGVSRSASRYDVARGKRSTWLYRVSFYRSRSFLERAYHRREVLETIHPDSEAIGPMLEENDPETQAIAEEDRRLVREAIEKIAINPRAVFIAYEIQERSMDEIARTLDIPESTGWSRLQQARNQFAVALKRLSAPSTRRKRL